MIRISIFVALLALATINITLAQNSTQGPHQHASLFGFPMPFDFSQIPFLGPFSQIGRQKRDTEAAEASHDEEHEDHQDRFFFGLFSHSTFVACNSSTQAGARCLSCTQALRCGGNNVGRLQMCHGFLPYCNVGRCSFFPGAQCANSTG